MIIRNYTNPLLLGKVCQIVDDFVPAMDLLVRYLKQTGCRALITSSLRYDTNVARAIVEPAKMSNHMVGCAIDCNVYDKNGRLWNSTHLRSPQDEVLDLINAVRHSVIMRWGGDFKKIDTVHFDNAINLKNPKRWRELYAEIQSNRT